MSSYIAGISRPCVMKFETEVIEGLVLDVELLDRVFKVPITTVKYIPHGCRLAFSQALKIVLYKVVAQPDSIDAWVRLLLFPRCTLQVCRPKNRQELKNMFDGSGLVSLGHGGGDFLEERATGNTNIRQCLRKVMDGHFTAAVKVLSSYGVAPYCDDTIKPLDVKHSYKPLSSIPSNTFSEPPLVVEIDSVFGCIKSFPKGTSCGRDSLRAQHILGSLCGEGSATATDLLKAITCPLILRGSTISRKSLMWANTFSPSIPLKALSRIFTKNVPLIPKRYFGLELNIMITKIFWPSCNGVKLREGLFPIDIQRPSLGVKLLGRC
ncbi:hypothetical protein Tco_1491940 [Tanacetum coccineum]